MWAVTGTDDAGVAAAAQAFDERALARRFAVAVDGGAPVGLPLEAGARDLHAAARARCTARAPGGRRAYGVALITLRAGLRAPAAARPASLRDAGRRGARRRRAAGRARAARSRCRSRC